MVKIKVSLADSYVYRWEGKNPLYLLLKRKESKFYGGLWQGVAGQIKRGEKAYETALRELKEETGLTPARIFIVEQIIRFYESHNDQITLVPVFGIEAASDKVRLSKEHSEYRWVNVTQAKRLLSWKQQKDVIATLHRMIVVPDVRMKWLEIDLG